MYVCTCLHLVLPSCRIEFGIAIGLTAFSFIIERNEGLLERTLAAGLSFAHTCSLSCQATLSEAKQASSVDLCCVFHRDQCDADGGGTSSSPDCGTSGSDNFNGCGVDLWV